MTVLRRTITALPTGIRNGLEAEPSGYVWQGGGAEARRQAEVDAHVTAARARALAAIEAGEQLGPRFLEPRAQDAPAGTGAPARHPHAARVPARQAQPAPRPAPLPPAAAPPAGAAPRPDRHDQPRSSGAGASHGTGPVTLHLGAERAAAPRPPRRCRRCGYLKTRCSC
jgi:hypothetical protein